MIDLSLILPTRDRTELVKRLFDNILETADDPSSLEVVLYVDTDDEESIQIACPKLSLVKLVRPRENMGTITRACYEASHGRYLALINDDIVFRTKKWDRIVKKAFSKFPDEVCLVYPNDSYYGKKMATFPILTRKACELMEGICPPDYQSHCIDAHAFDIFVRLAKRGHSRMVYLPQVVFEHMQFGLGSEAYDVHPEPKNDLLDQIRYQSFEGLREKIARNMEEEIQTRAREAKQKISLPFLKEVTPYASLILLAPPHEEPLRMVECLHGLEEQKEEMKHLHEILILAYGELSQISFYSRTSFSRRLRRKLNVFPLQQGTFATPFVNFAALGAQGSFLVFLNTDSSPQRNWLSSLFDLAKDEKVGLAGSKWIHPRTGRIEHAGIAFFESLKGLAASMIYRGFRADHPLVNRVREFQVVALSGMIIRKSLFRDVEGFSDSFPTWAQFDLCSKVRRLGKKVLWNPQAVLECEGEKLPEALPEAWRDLFELDLAAVLLNDGFLLQQVGEPATIVPTQEKVLTVVP